MADAATLTLVQPLSNEEKRIEKRAHAAAYARKWRASHPETPDQRVVHAKRSAADFAANKAKRVMQNVAWAKAHPDSAKGYYKKYRLKNPERVRAASAAWLASRPHYRKGYWLRYSYGLTIEAFDALLQVQNGCCAICRTPFTRTPHVDHVHDETGRVRGLLCKQCNLGIGYFRDTPEFLAAAIAYLRPKETP